MTRDELLALLRAGEDTLTEFKTQPHESDVKRALVALANTVGPDREGVLFLGAKPGGTPAGVEDADSLGRKVATWAGECYPSVQVECTTLPVDGKDVIAVTVRHSAERPHFAAPAYVRDGPKTVKAPPSVYEELIASRNTIAGAILRHKGETITVVVYRRWPAIGNSPASVLPGAPEECRIEGCSEHSVELRSLGSGGMVSFPLHRVVITADPKHLRPLMLTITAA